MTINHHRSLRLLEMTNLSLMTMMMTIGELNKRLDKAFFKCFQTLENLRIIHSLNTNLILNSIYLKT